MEKRLNIAIVGLGVIGGSFAWALKEQTDYNVRVLGLDHDPETLSLALEAGAIDAGELVNKMILQEADLVILTLYPNAIVDFVRTHRDEFKKGAILTDSTGIKGNIVDQVVPILPEGVDFIFGHPMAGKESQGFAYADADTFQDANYLLTPIATNKEENVAFLTALLKTLGFKRVRQVEAQVHDEMIAFVSQLCHVLAVSLINSDEAGRDTAAFVGDTYRELTRIAKINGPLWSELFLNNKTELLTVMENFESQFQLMKQAIKQEDEAGLIGLFEEATARRVKLEQSDSKLQGRQHSI